MNRAKYINTDSSYPSLPTQRLRFWFCYVDGQGTPSHKHYSLVDAKKEAERLANQNHSDVFVLEATEVVRYIPPTPPPGIEWQETTK